MNALRQYHYVWDATRRVFSNKPQDDWSADLSDAYRYVGLVHDQVNRDRWKPYEGNAAGMDEPIFSSHDEDEIFEPRRNRVGGFVSSDRPLPTFTEVVATDPVTGRIVRYYK